MPDWLPPLILAPVFGSLAALLVRRLPAGMPVVLGRSRCESCGHALGPLELVPILGFLALRGRCRHCGARIAPAHLAIELACLGIAAWVVLAEADPARLWPGCVLGWLLLALAWTDWETMLLPDALTLPLLAAGLAATWWLAPEDLAAHAAAAALGFLLLHALALAYRRLRGQEGIGAGDAVLLAAAGAWLGPLALPGLILLAAGLGLVLAAALRLAGREVGADTALPFGPPLCLATWLGWWGLDPAALLP